jgi:hypothetical protein
VKSNWQCPDPAAALENGDIDRYRWRTVVDPAQLLGTRPSTRAEQRPQRAIEIGHVSLKLLEDRAR